jgi:bifunctional DNase/RNase
MIIRAVGTVLVLAVSLFTSFDGAADKEPVAKDAIKVEVAKLLMSEENRSVILLLKPEADPAMRKVLPLVIGFEEARSIGVAFHKVEVPRPLSHDLMKTIIQEYDGSVESCVITKMENQIFYAELRLKKEGREMVIDCRPSDAIALSMRWNTPVYVRREVFEKHGVDPSKPQVPDNLPKA